MSIKSQFLILKENDFIFDRYNLFIMELIADHFAFLVSNMDLAIKFYSEKLGMKFISRNSDSEHGEEFAFLELKGGNLELISKDKTHTNEILQQFNKDTEIRAFCPHLALKTDNLETLLKQFKEKGVPIENGPNEIPGMAKWIYISDPDGNILEFVQWMNDE